MRTASLMLTAAASGLLAVRADATPSDAELAAAFETFKATQDARMAALETTATALEAEFNSNALREAGRSMHSPGVREGDGQPADPEYRATFASYTRQGATSAEAILRAANTTGERASLQAAMSEGDNSAGGYLAPIEWDRQIRKAQRHLSPLRRIAQVITTGVNGYSTLWSNETWGSGWVGETATRPTTTAASLSPLVFPTGEIYAMPAATQRLIDDAAINFEEWLAAELGEEFARQEGVAFVAGNGVNKPMGFLQYLPGGAAADGQAGAHPGGMLGVTASGFADKLDPDALVSVKYGLATPYRQNATWVMNSNTAAVIAKMKDGQGGYIWREGLMLDQPATLLGRPVEIDENMPDVAAGATPIAIGDFNRGYLVNDRIGVRILRDPYTAKPYVMFYATKRVGGGVLDPRAIRVLRIAAA